MVCHERSNRSCIERIGVEDHAQSARQRQHEGSRKSEGVEEGQDAEYPVVAVESEALVELRDVRNDIVVREHDALGIAGAAAGKDHRSEISWLNLFTNKHRCRKKPRLKIARSLSRQTRFCSSVFEQDRPSR